MSSNRYVPRSIQNIFDRLEARNERSDKESFSTELPKVFQVTVYDSATPEVRSPTTQAHVTTATSTADNFYKYRARSLAGHNDLQPAPETAKFRGEYERLRNAHFQAIVRKDLEVSEFPQTGDVWMATYLGGNLVELTSRVRFGTFTLSLQDGNGPAQNAHTNGQNPTTTVGATSGATPTPASSNTPPYSGPSNAPASNVALPVYDAVQKELLAYISAGEGGYDASNNGTRDVGSGIVNSFGGKSYVAYMNVTATKTSPDQKLLSTLTIGEIVDFQGWNTEFEDSLKNATFESRYPAGTPNGSTRTLFAVGAYQIIPATMKFALKQTGYGREVVFTPEVQQNLAMSLIYGNKREILRKYLKGDASITNHQAMDSFSKEWASIPSATKWSNGWTSAKTGAVFPAGESHSHYDLPNRAGHTYAETKALLEKVRQHNIDNGFTE